LWEELSSAHLNAGEQEALEEELKMLENAEEIKLKLNEVLQFLSQGEYSVQPSLYAAENSLSQIAGYSQKYSELYDRVKSCLIEVKDINDEIESEEMLVEFDQEKIEIVNDRLSLVYKLQQKHRVASVEALISLQNELEERYRKSVM
jgi:DNA repair protein RecN (Recombination protein N)